MERGIFFQSLAPYFFPNLPLILAGDFNCYHGSLDKMGGSVSIDARLTDLKSTNFLWDAWRLKHPRDHQFTWFNSDLSLASRLDSLIIPRYLRAQVISCKIHLCVCFDPDFVYIELNLHTTDRRGPGVWKFNKSLLQDRKFCCAILDWIDHFLRFRFSFPSDLVMWDRLKCSIKSFTINYSRERWRRQLINWVFLNTVWLQVVLKLNLKFENWRLFLTRFLIYN